MGVDLPLLSVEVQTMTPDECKRILDDAKEEMKSFTTYRVYEVTKNSMANMDDLAELPIILGKLTKDLAEEVIQIQGSAKNLQDFLNSADIK